MDQPTQELHIGKRWAPAVGPALLLLVSVGEETDAVVSDGIRM
jgi:hypothetical protein